MYIIATDKIEKNLNTIVIAVDINRIKEVKKNYPEIANYIDSECFDTNEKSRVSIPIIVNGKKVNYKLITLKDEISKDELLDEFGKVAKEFTLDKVKSVFIDLSLSNFIYDTEKVLAALKGIAHGSYCFNKFLAEKKSIEPESVAVYSCGKIDGEIFTRVNNINRSIKLAKEMVDEPANIMTPEKIAKVAEESLKETNVEVKIFEKKEIEEIGMELFLNVAKGAENEPKLIVMRYMGNPESSEIIALVGKGLAYDTGGYSIKGTKYMKDMKSDMGGAAAVIGAMNLIASEDKNINVVGIVATCENRISGGSYLPGDILKSMNGKTVEIEDTDAEGRLTLADAITYAIRNENASKIVDICTLTGACVVALGEEYAGVVTKEDALWEKVEVASLKSLDPCWRLPLNKNMVEKTKGKVADLKNVGGQPGCETAAAFVGEFTENLPWVHIDIAGTAMIENEKEYLREGATGFGVHLLGELVNIL